MRGSRAATRKRIIESAYALFYRHGFARVGMAEIAKRAEVTKRTLYAYVESKDALLAEVLEHHRNLGFGHIDRWISRLDRRRAPSVKAIFEELTKWSSHNRWSGSGFTRLAMELSDLPGHPARAIARRHKRAVEARLATALGSSLAAAQFLILLEGAMALLVVHGDPRYARIAADAAVDLLNRHQS